MIFTATTAAPMKRKIVIVFNTLLDTLVALSKNCYRLFVFIRSTQMPLDLFVTKSDTWKTIFAPFNNKS